MESRSLGALRWQVVMRIFCSPGIGREMLESVMRKTQRSQILDAIFSSFSKWF